MIPTAVAERPASDPTRDAGGTILSIMAVVMVMTACLAAPLLIAERRPSNADAARAWDASQARMRALEERTETLRLRDVRTTIVGNMPDECRVRVAATLPSDRPMSEHDMLTTTLRICPQSGDDE